MRMQDGALRDRKSKDHLWAHCPVCNMRVDKWTAKFKSEYEDKPYIFCSARCQERFQEEPESYKYLSIEI